MYKLDNIKYKDIPSIPILKWQKLNWLNSYTNWYVVELKSNWNHKITEISKFNKDVNKAIFFILDNDSILLFSIGNNKSTPIKGTINKRVIINCYTFNFS